MGMSQAQFDATVWQAYNRAFELGREILRLGLSIEDQDRLVQSVQHGLDEGLYDATKKMNEVTHG